MTVLSRTAEVYRDERRAGSVSFCYGDGIVEQVVNTDCNHPLALISISATSFKDTHLHLPERLLRSPRKVLPEVVAAERLRRLEHVVV